VEREGDSREKEICGIRKGEEKKEICERKRFFLILVGGIQEKFKENHKKNGSNLND
jgi:hypothetical protein